MQQAGNYLGVLKKGVLSRTKTSGGLQFALIFDVTHYQNGNAWADLQPFERTIFLSMEGGAKPYTKQKLAALGYTDAKLEKGENGEQLMVLPEGISDQQIALICKHENYQGNDKERWDLANWGGGVVGEKATDEDAMKLAAIW